MNIIKLRVNGLTGFPLMHTSDFSHKKSKRPHASHEPKSLRDAQGLVLPIHLCNHFGNPHVFYQPAILSTQGIVSTQKTLCNVFQPSRTKPTHTLSIEQEKKLM